MRVNVREAVKSDIEALIRCHKEFMEHHIKRDKRFALKEGAAERWTDQIIEAVNNPDTFVLAAEDEGTIVGCAYTIIKSGAVDFGPEKIEYLCDVYVFLITAAWGSQGVS